METVDLEDEAGLEPSPRPVAPAEARAEDAPESEETVVEPAAAELPEEPEPELRAVCGGTRMGPPFEDIAVCPTLTEWSGEIPTGHTECVFAAWTTGSQPAEAGVAHFAKRH